MIGEKAALLRLPRITDVPISAEWILRVQTLVNELYDEKVFVVVNYPEMQSGDSTPVNWP